MAVNKTGVKEFFQTGLNSFKPASIKSGISSAAHRVADVAAAVLPMGAIGAVHSVVSYPGRAIINSIAEKHRVNEIVLEFESDDGSNTEGVYDSKRAHNRRIENRAKAAHFVNNVGSGILVWGAVVAIGVISLPILATVAGFGLGSAVIDLGVSVLTSRRIISLKNGIILAATLKVAAVAAVTIGVVLLSTIAPPVAIAVGISLIAITLFSATYQYNQERLYNKIKNLFSQS